MTDAVRLCIPEISQSLVRKIIVGLSLQANSKLTQINNNNNYFYLYNLASISLLQVFVSNHKGLNIYDIELHLPAYRPLSLIVCTACPAT